MSKRSIRKNRHRSDKGANRKTWPNSERLKALATLERAERIVDEASDREVVP